VTDVVCDDGPTPPEPHPVAGWPSDDDDTVVYDLFKAGRDFLDTRHPGQAVLCLERAVRLAPDKTSIRETLGRAHFAMAQYACAADDFAEVVRRAPTNDYCLFGLGRALMADQRPREALGSLRAACAMAPDNGDYAGAFEECLAMCAELGEGGASR
jgi:cytochrome c-type biogenesis protein CcmH/NrfG